MKTLLFCAKGFETMEFSELLNKEAEELANATKYERTEKRQGYRSGQPASRF